MDDFGIQLMKTQSSYLKKMCIFHPTNKRSVFNTKITQPLNNYIQLCTQYLVGNHFAEMTALMRRGMEAISLWHR